MATGKLKTTGVLHLDNIDLKQWKALENRHINHFDITGQVEKSPGEMGTLKFRVNYASCDRSNYTVQKKDINPMQKMAENLCVFFLNEKISTIWFLLASVGINNPKLVMIMHVPEVNFTAYSIQSSEKQFFEEHIDDIDQNMIKSLLKKFKGRSPFSA